MKKIVIGALGAVGVIGALMVIGTVGGVENGTMGFLQAMACICAGGLMVAASLGAVCKVDEVM